MWLCTALAPLNPALFKGQLYLILGIKIYTFKMYQHLARQIRACTSQWQQHSNIVIKHDLVLLHRKPALGIQLYGPGNSCKLFLISCSLAIPTLWCIVTKTCSGTCLHLHHFFTHLYMKITASEDIMLRNNKWQSLKAVCPSQHRYPIKLLYWRLK